MRFHVAALPHTIVTKSYSNCAYTQKIYNFCVMMMSLGHEVFLYAAEGSDAPCTELITCISNKEQLDLIGVAGPEDNLKAAFDPDTIYWRLFNNRIAAEMIIRRQPQDFLCLIAGRCQQEIAEVHADMMTVEFGVGYGGVFAPYKVFESYAWMHTVYGSLAGDPHTADGNYFDTVIPNYFDPEDFPFAPDKEDYYLFVGRLIDRKGWRIAQQVCEKLGKRLIVAGQGEFTGYGEYVGVIGPERRGELMSRAKAVFVPSQYIEPFGGVHAEAQLCGTPVITPDFGAFTETVEDGVNGFRCHSFQDYLNAAEAATSLDPFQIHRNAVDRYGMDQIKYQYEAYFTRLLTLYGDGWYTLA